MRFKGFNQRTRLHLIPHIMGTAHIHDIIMYRMINFILAGVNHKDNVINNFFRNCLLSNTSYTFTNLNKIIGNFNINYLKLFDFNKNKLKNKLNEKTGKGDWQYNILEELLNMKETRLEANLDITETKILIDYISTS